MAKGISSVKGNITPEVGEKNIYEVASYYPRTIIKDENDIQWKLYVLESSGKWRELRGPQKTGKTVAFTFPEKWLEKKLLIEAYVYNAEKKSPPGLIVAPKSAKIPKINKVELFYVDDSPGKVFSYTEKLVAKANSVNLTGEKLVFTLWEDDAKGDSHNAKNLFIDSKSVTVGKNGVANVEFLLTKALMQKAMQGETDSKELEFYVTVEYYKNKKHATNNVDVKNPDYKPPVQPKSPSQPQNIPKKAEGSPAARKPASKKEEKGILETIVDKGKELWDWWETPGTVKPEKKPTPQKNDEKTATTIDKMSQKKREEQERKCFCNRDFEEKDVRNLVKLLKGTETIWEGQALKGGKRATCNISDKSFAALTNGINSAFKKYKINTCAQKMHFLAQTCEETGTFSLSEETKSQYASSTSVYKGRGLLQLTGVKKNENDEFYNEPGPYKDYADYKGDQNIVKNPSVIANNVDYCIDSGAWIWSINKKMPTAPSKAVDRWGTETSGKTLNELAIFVDKYLELISVLLNGRGSNGMPNGWAKRKSNYDLLKTGFFMYDCFHGDNNKPANAKGLVTYHIYSDGKIERHIPKIIKPGFETKYKYIYHDSNNKVYEVCTVDWIEIDKVKREKPNPSTIPVGYISHETFNVEGVNQKHLYKYSDGTIIASGDAGEGGEQ